MPSPAPNAGRPGTASSDTGRPSTGRRGTDRPRLLPGIVAAAALVVAAAFGALAVIDRHHPASMSDCAAGQQWVTVRPVVVVTSGWQITEVDAANPSLSGCLDTRHLPASTRQLPTDSRG